MSSGSYALECTLERDGIRILKSMLMCLDRFGKDLFLEAHASCVTLRTLNAAQSAFIIFTLNSDLFSRYKTDGRETPASVKLHLKNVTSIFRSIAGVERVWLQISTGSEGGGDGDAEEEEEEAGYMRVQLQCQSGLRKKFDLAFQEIPSMNAVYDLSACPHTIRADPSKILDCLKNFPSMQSEVTMVATDDALLLKNEVDAGVEAEGGGAGPAVRTEMRLAAEHLIEYSLGLPRPQGGVCVAFSQKEFKAVLTLVRDLEHSLACHIEGAGRPIIFGSSPAKGPIDGAGPGPFRVECVLATVVETTPMCDDEDFFGDDAPPPQQHATAGTAADSAANPFSSSAPSAHAPAPPSVHPNISGPSFHGQYPHGPPPPYAGGGGGSQQHPSQQQHYPHQYSQQQQQYSQQNQHQHQQPPPPYSQQQQHGYRPHDLPTPPPYHPNGSGPGPSAHYSQHAPQHHYQQQPPQYHQQQQPHYGGGYYGGAPPMPGSWPPQDATQRGPPRSSATQHPPDWQRQQPHSQPYGQPPPGGPWHGGGGNGGAAMPGYGGGGGWQQPPSGGAGGFNGGSQPAGGWSQGSFCVPATPAHDGGHDPGGPAWQPPPGAHPSSMPPHAAMPAEAQPPAAARGGGGDQSDDTEEDEDVVPGTPPDPEWEPSKRPRMQGEPW